MDIDQITTSEANAALAGHYLGPLPFPATYALAESPEHMAVATFCNPSNSGFTRALPGCLELTRLWQSDERRERVLEFGVLSRFVRATLGWIKSRDPHRPCVLSYTDPAQGHHGGVYQASRFKSLGTSTVTDEWRDPLDERVTARSLYRELGTKDRAVAEANGFARIQKVPKILFVYPLAVRLADIRKAIGGRYDGTDIMIEHERLARERRVLAGS